MKHLIDKDALVAEIEKIIEEPAPSHDSQCLWEDGYYCGLYKAESILDTFEVKEMDLDTDFGICWGNYIDCGGNINNYEVAKHFFELGLNAQKGEKV